MISAPEARRLSEIGEQMQGHLSKASSQIEKAAARGERSVTIPSLLSDEESRDLMARIEEHGYECHMKRRDTLAHITISW